MSKGRFQTRTKLIAAGLVIVLAGATATVSVTDGLRWRTKVIALKCAGRLPDLTWSDLRVMLLPHSGIYLRGLADTPNPYAVISNPYGARSDVEAGQALFQARCANCHGSEGAGAAGPALAGRELTRGASDWALYRAVRNGIPGTAMPEHRYGTRELWQLVAYVRALSIGNRSGDGADARAPAAPVSLVKLEAMRAARSAGADWPTYYGSYNGYRYSEISEIDRTNVGDLRVRWVYQLPAYQGRVEATPLAAGGRLFVTDPDGGVIALDARSGHRLWRFQHDAPADVRLCCQIANRGVAIVDDRVYVATLDAHLIALDGATGVVIWDRTIADYRAGYSSTGAPLAIKGMIVTGIAGSEFGAPGFVAAFDQRSGEPVWRFETIPHPGEPGNETWGRGSWRMGGAATWMTGTYDPQLDLIFWGIANAAPDYDAAERPGDNLYSNSVVALHADSGRLAWYFQFTPGDDHDWDAVQVPVLADFDDSSGHRSLVLTANRNGFFYALDRSAGTFLSATPFVRQTWASGITAAGRPIRRPEAAPTEKGVLLYPGSEGATNWWPPTYHPGSGLFIVPALEQAGLFFKSVDSELSEKNMTLRGASTTPTHNRYSAIRALDPRTGSLRWEHRSADLHGRGHLCGLMSTAGGLVFGCDETRIIALDIDTGRLLWSFDTGSQIFSAAATYVVDDEQIVTIASGNVVLSFGLPPRKATSQSPATQALGRKTGLTGGPLR